jgi:hypothetical protein
MTLILPFEQEPNPGRKTNNDARKAICAEGERPSRIASLGLRHAKSAYAHLFLSHYCACPFRPL